MATIPRSKRGRTYSVQNPPARVVSSGIASKPKARPGPVFGGGGPKKP